MAEITYNDLLGQLSGMEKDQFEGIGFGSKGFLENYQNDPNSVAVTQHDNFSKFEPIAKAYQESKTIPKGNFLSNMFNFSSADAAIPDQTYGLQTNTMGGMTLNEDGTISYNTQTPPNLGFRSMVDMAADTENFMGQFNTPQAANRYSGMGQMGPVKSDMAAPRALDMERFAGVSELGRNDEDVEQVEYLGSPSKFQNFKSRIDDGLGSFRNKASQGWNLAQQLPGMAMGALSGIPGIGMLMNAIGNQFEDRTLGTSNVVDEYGNVHSSADLNKQNARGGGYTEAARSSRRARARLNNVLARKAAGKKYGNLDELLEISRKQQELDNLGYAGTPGGNTGSGAFAKFDNTSKNYGPHTKGGGNQGGGFSGAGAGTGSRGPRSRDGGIIMDKNFYANGGLATLFTRRG